MSLNTNTPRRLPTAVSTEWAKQMVEVERDMIRNLVAKEVEKQVSVAMEKNKQPPAQSWNPITLATSFFCRTQTDQLPNLTSTSPSDTNTKPSEIAFPPEFPAPLELFDEFGDAYPHYSMDPWEFDFGLLAVIQKLKYSEIRSKDVDCYIGMIPTYRHLKDQEKTGKRGPLPRYTEFIDMVAGISGYNEGVITREKLNRLMASSAFKEMHALFKGVRDDYFFIEDAGDDL